ncbi:MULTISPECIES: AAA family ATPase [Bradyrhizobium]|uniref:AAA family ATPase n=1 Tax=Bradyrhizobium barranii subsp. barranii TaxID=2823807 RepID=A0A7Z0QLU8_9BRAD|nr:AAA family ATPase [Bradyrhizobium barranii]MBR0868178.1 AAA family ATPase [Bradyrhizobium diazoefficiens]MBR0884201.1 AAA family ATPase [Bradyrhizobium liaoningense]MBR0892699.1 AAA family ATPase [Bradyrhizobium diazoefficiens]MBR0924140.1 AAA family ATPase [Bradyrhizobium diazoefficiens]MBR0947474.1 AAA family ATPase [Bradyrhizobium liaoningense]
MCAIRTAREDQAIEIPVSALSETIKAAVELAPKSTGSIALEGLDVHPRMVPWVKQGHEYHVEHDLRSCLHCGQAITDQRKALLTATFDDKLSQVRHRTEHCRATCLKLPS